MKEDFLGLVGAVEGRIGLANFALVLARCEMMAKGEAAPAPSGPMGMRCACE